MILDAISVGKEHWILVETTSVLLKGRRDRIGDGCDSEKKMWRRAAGSTSRRVTEFAKGMFKEKVSNSTRLWASATPPSDYA